jgi:glycosyltransferase involved in cell wall biosynthesis
MRKRAKVTALVPAYQASEFIQPTLDSLSAQTYGDFHVIVSTDLCSDNTFDVCMRHCEQDSRFRVIRQGKRLGYVENCNFLLSQTDADYVLFAFHDDILSPSYVEKLCKVLDERPEVVMSYSDVMVTDVKGVCEHRVFTELDGLHNRVQRGLKMLRRPRFWSVPNHGLFRLSEARKIQGFKTHGAGEFSADRPWLFHMSLLGEFARVPETLCYKFYKPASLSRGWEFSARQHYEASVACMREIKISELSAYEKLRLAVPLSKVLIKANLKFFGDTVKQSLFPSRA